MTEKELAYIANGAVMCDSRTVADKFANGKHARIKNVVEKLIKRHNDYMSKGNSRLPLSKDDQPIWILKESVYRGQKFTHYEMNRSAFSLVAMRFQTDQAYEWQLKFIAIFNAMERALINQGNIEWEKQRAQSKLVRKDETDMIQKFVEYATKQGSKNAKFYYKHFTTATYKALGLIQHKKPKLRDTLNLLETSQLILAENIALESLKENMNTGEHYKAIFVNVKNDIEKYASTLFLPNNKRIQ